MTAAPDCIRLTDVAFQWSNNSKYLIDIPSLCLHKHEKLFIHGPSGSGKSTLLNLITGVLPPSKGDISILGQKLSEQKAALRDQFRVDHFGIIFQQFNLIPYLSVIENVSLPCLFSQRRNARIEVEKKTLSQESTRLLQALGLSDPSIKDRNVTELSTGQQQRVAAARALLGSPEIIIADEPTSSLDSDAKQSFIQLLFQEIQASGSALIFVSHDRSLVNGFDRVLSFDEINRIHQP